MVQDAAHASLLRARRQQIHSRIAQVLADKYPEMTTRQPEVLAHHSEAAGLQMQAKEWWSRAGRLALANATYAEATNHLARALALVQDVDRVLQKREANVERRRLAAWSSLGQVVVSANEFIYVQ